MNQIKREKRIIIKHLDLIVSTCAEIAKAWGSNTIPLATLEVILNTAKSKVTGDSYQANHAKAFNKCLDSLFKGACEITAKMESKSIPVSEIKKGVEIIKGAYK